MPSKKEEEEGKYVHAGLAQKFRLSPQGDRIHRQKFVPTTFVRMTHERRQ